MSLASILAANTTDIPFLKEIVLILGLSVLVIYLFRKVKLPAILGFLATGILFGPNAIGIASQGEEIEMLSEIGVILLLFIIGLEFSLKNLMSIRKVVFIGGSIQVLLTIAITAGISFLLGYELTEAVMLGFLFALSSTAIVLKLLQEKGLMRSNHGRISLGVLIFQDIIVVPMILLVPIISGQESNVAGALAILAVKALFLVVAIYVSARYLVPRLLHEIARTRSRELFLITIIVICFAVAFVTSLMGLSLALGAFMAGLCISESEYSHQATGLIIPFREIFTSFFFVSIGMLLDLNFLMMHLPVVLLFTVLAAALKFAVLVLAARVLRFSLKTSILVGLSLLQVGEFAFILSRTGMDAGLISELTNQYFLSVSILTMAATPFLIDYGERISNFLLRIPSSRFKNDTDPVVGAQAGELKEKLSAHLVIIGYGTNGRNAARTAKEAKIPYVIIDHDAEVVAKAKEQGEHIIFGDGSNPFILEYVHIYNARVAVVAIPDHQKAIGVVANIREICNTVHIIVRSKSIPETEEMLHMGASEAISEEFEASVEVFARMLNQFLIKPDQIDGYITMVRDEAYSEVHSNYHYYKKDALGLNEIKALSLTLTTSCPFTGKNLCETPLMEKYKVRLIGFYRNGQFISNLDGATRLHEGDEIIVFGADNDLKGFKAEWDGRPQTAEESILSGIDQV
jgi:CPA2 family monovalent cation:H+ antiporter-2